MYTVNNDPRVFITPVRSCGGRASVFAPAPEGEERVFRNGAELVRCLAAHTDTHGYADPARWTNSLISRQFIRGRAARTWVIREGWYNPRSERWYGRITEDWDYWFHDARGRTVDARSFWPDVIREIRRETGSAASFRLISFGPGRKRHSGGRCEGRKGRTGFYRFLEAENGRGGEEEEIRRGTIRPGLLETAQFFHDWDWFENRARHSTGWKEHKCRCQWEHGVREREKHERNRVRKALRRGEYPAAPE